MHEKNASSATAWGLQEAGPEDMGETQGQNTYSLLRQAPTLPVGTSSTRVQAVRPLYGKGLLPLHAVPCSEVNHFHVIGGFDGVYSEECCLPTRCVSTITCYKVSI